MGWGWVVQAMTHELRTPLNGIIGLTDGIINGSFGALPPYKPSALYLHIKGEGRQHILVQTSRQGGGEAAHSRADQ